MEKYKGSSLYAHFKDEQGNEWLSLYGDTSHWTAGYEMAASTASSPEEADLSDHKKIAFSFKFKGIQPLEKILPLAEKLMAELEKDGWQKVKTELSNLADTNEIKYLGKPEENFPQEPQVNGHNAAEGFLLTVEKKEEKPDFLDEEVEALKSKALEFGKIVFGAELEEVKNEH
ncbi:MAG: hypothetical protein V1770_00955 [bacterium]